jgi:hypothetical protein
VAPGSPRARDLALLDAIDALKRERFEDEVFRVAREGRDPLQGGPSRSRWCNGAFDVLYTSREADGARAEIFAFLSLQPVFPSQVRFGLHRLRAKADKTLVFADIAALRPYGVDGANYVGRDYSRTMEIADAAYFLGFDGIIAPSARFPCANVVLFTERIGHAGVELVATEDPAIDWALWRKRHAR